MKYDQTDDTIVAVSSPLSGAARGIVRLSGRTCTEVLSAALQTEIPSPSKAVRQSVSFPLDAFRSVYADLYLWPNGHSYTGEQSAEIHTVGSLPLLNRIVERLIQSGARAAEGGEFTFRAFLSGNLDLTQAEAVLGLIEAADQSAFKAAARQLAGGFSDKLNSIRDELKDTLVHLEAGFDFAEEDISFISADELFQRITRAQSQLKSVIGQLNLDSQSHFTPKVVLIGSTNAGKSSLLNALTENSTAIVSPVRGSTRDYLTKTVVWNNISLNLIDTAGWEQLAASDSSTESDVSVHSSDSIGYQMQKMALQQRHQADFVVLCLPLGSQLEPWQTSLLQQNRVHLLVWTKSDLAKSETNEKNKNTSDQINTISYSGEQQITSTVTGAGIDALRQKIVKLIENRHESQTEILATTSKRCQANLEQMLICLENALQLSRPDFAADSLSNLSDNYEELIAQSLRTALNYLGEIVGTVYTEDILEGIFGRFCVGK